jgi:hypothetical protein
MLQWWARREECAFAHPTIVTGVMAALDPAIHLLRKKFLQR